MDWSDIIAVVLIICCIPVIVLLFYILAKFFRIIFFHNQVDLEDVIFSKARIKQVDKSNIEQERNFVSIQEAVAVSNYKNQRELMMNVLRKDMKQSLGSISYALNSDDTETSHYAAAALRDELGDFRSSSQKLYNEIKDSDTVQAEKCSDLIQTICDMVRQKVFLPTEQKQYTKMLDELMRIMLERCSGEFKPEYYEWIVGCMLEIGENVSAGEWCRLADKNLSGMLTPYKCYLRYYYDTDNGEKFIQTIEKLKNTDIVIDSDTLEIFRMFG